MRIRGLGVAKSKLNQLKYKFGKFFFRYQCPFCKCFLESYDPLPSQYINDYLNVGGNLRVEDWETLNYQNYQCPHCKGSDRDRLIYLYFKHVIEKLSEGNPDNEFRILDIAPCPPMTILIKQDLKDLNLSTEYRSCDLYDTKVDDKIDIMNMTAYKNCSFDLFICSHVLEHVRDDKRAILELYRILKPHGKGILLVPINISVNEIDEDPNLEDEHERIRRFGQANHVRLYSHNGFIERLQSSGLEVNIMGKNQFGPEVFKKYALTDTSCLYIVSKN